MTMTSICKTKSLACGAACVETGFVISLVESKPTVIALEDGVDLSRISSSAPETDSSNTSYLSSAASSSISSCDSLEEDNHNRSMTVPMSDEADIYGQRHPIENPSLISSKLIDFDFEVKQLDDHDKVALLLAQQKCPTLLTNQFKLMFLRCECYNASKAAVRYAKYWDKRYELFGSQGAFLPITLQNMPTEDRIPLSLCAMHVIRRNKTSTTESSPTTTTTTSTDERDFVFMDPSKLQPGLYSRESGCRAFWYIFHSLLEDEHVQKHGLIVVNFVANVTSKNRDPRFIRMLLSCFLGCLPLRLSAYHVWHPPTWARIVTQVVMSVVCERIRQRVMIHGGSGASHNDKVVSMFEEKYRIPRSYLPTIMGGSYELNIHQWLEERISQGR